MRKYLSQSLLLLLLFLILSAPLSADLGGWWGIDVTISPASVWLLAGGTQQFRADVSGTFNTAVTWSATGGTISPSGLYTAPSTSGTYTVTARSWDDWRQSASATVTVIAPVAVSVTPAAAALLTGGTQQFTATVIGTSNTAVSWSATEGTVSSSGLYSAPSTSGTYTVTATSAADATRSASATVVVTEPVAVSLVPAVASLSAGGTQQFTATVIGASNTAVSWSATEGTVSFSGLYTAPSTSGAYTVTATSAADATKSASATVVVTEPVAVSLVPAVASLSTGGTQQFTATVSGSTDTAVAWSATAGSITSSGMYTAPPTAGTYIVTATSVADTTKSASATVTVAAAASGVLLGDQNVERTLDSNAAGRAQAFQTTASASGLLGSLNLYLDATSTASQVAIGLYSDAGGHPSVLLSQATFTPTAGSWNTVTVPPAPVVAGTPYWIAVLGLGSGRPYFRDTMTGCTSEGSSSGTLDSLPATWSTGGLWTACTLSAYGLGIAAPSPSTVLVFISPPVSLLPAGGTQQFTATVTGSSNTTVTWSATGGTVSPSGLYTAPSSSGAYTVTATSMADTSQSASAMVTVSAPLVAVLVSPTAASLPTGGTQPFTATVTGTSNTAVTWAATGGSISSSGLYTAPATAGTYTVTATSTADTTKSASATVTVSAPVVAVSVSPALASLPTGGTQPFTATVTGTNNTAVTWAATGGSISSSGLYTAPATAGTYAVTATSAADPTKSASATVTVTAPAAHAVTLSWTASTSSVVGYNVYRATQSGGPYTMINTALQPGTSYADLSVQAGNTYYYVVTAMDSSGPESVNSNEVTAAVPAP